MKDTLDTASGILFYINYFKEILIALIGGATAYLFRYHQEKEKNNFHTFSIALFLINIILGGFIGYLIGSIIPPENPYKNFLIGMSGIAAYPLLAILETNLVRILGKLTYYFLKIPTEIIELEDPKKNKKEK